MQVMGAPLIDPEQRRQQHVQAPWCEHVQAATCPTSCAATYMSFSWWENTSRSCNHQVEIPEEEEQLGSSEQLLGLTFNM